MTALSLISESAVTVQNTLNFPNLFGGTQIKYYRGFEVFGFPIYWYGVLIAIGIVLAVAYVMPRLEKVYGLSRERAFDVIFISTIGGFVGARIYYCVFTTLNPASEKTYTFITTFTEIRDGGIAIYGGIIAAFLIGLLVCKIRKVNYFAMCDAASLGFLIGQTIGRWGNFVNQEAYGADCPKDWLFAMSGSLIKSQGETGVVHPCFLYESVWCLLGFIFLHIYSKKLRTYDGEVFLLYIAWYGLERFFVEALRTDSLMAGDVRISQIVAVISCGLALALFVFFKIFTKKKNIPLCVNSETGKAILEADKKAEEERKAKKAARKSGVKQENITGESAVNRENITEENNDISENISENPDEENNSDNTAEIREENKENIPENTPENNENNENNSDEKGE